MIRKHPAGLAKQKSQLLALMSDVPAYKRAIIRDQIAIIDTAQAAENTLHDMLYREFRDDADVQVMHDICLPGGHGQHHRVNTIIVDGRSHNIWVIRTLGSKGELEREDNGKWRVHYPKTSRRIACPQAETLRHREAVAKALIDAKITNLSLRPIVLIGPKTKYSLDGDHEVSVISAVDFIERFKHERRKSSPISVERMEEITFALLSAHHQPDPTDWRRELKLGKARANNQSNWSDRLGALLHSVLPERRGDDL